MPSWMTWQRSWRIKKHHSFNLYKQGMELLKFCSDKLDTVEKKMLQMNEDGTFSEFSR